MAGPAADPLPLPVLPSATLHPSRPWLPWNLINQAGRPLGPHGSTGWARPGSWRGGPQYQERVNLLALNKMLPEQKDFQDQFRHGGARQRRWLNYRERRVWKPGAWPCGLQNGVGDQLGITHG